MKRRVLAKTSPFHTLLKKKDPKTVSFWTALFTMHVNSGETHCLHGPGDPAQLKMFGSGPAQFKKLFLKNTFEKL